MQTHKTTDYTRERYSPVLVSILITSSLSQQTVVHIRVAPVSTVAGFVAPVAVSPLKPGSVSVICKLNEKWWLNCKYIALV